MFNKIAAFVVCSAAITVFLYLFGLFVSFEANVTHWQPPGRFLTGAIWTGAHIFLIVAAFGSRSTGDGNGR